MPFIYDSSSLSAVPGDEYVLIANGYTSEIFRIPGSRRVCKSFLGNGRETRFAIEKEAYERFSLQGPPSSILRYYGVDSQKPTSIVLEFAENGPLYNYVAENYEEIPLHRFYQWARQATEALIFVHSCGVLHSDVHCMNFFLDEHLNLKVGDFGEASIDGGRSLNFYRTTHTLPGTPGASVASEVFAMGSSMYNMVAGHDLFPELEYPADRDEIKRRLRQGEFPDTQHFPALGAIVRKCWNREIQTMAELLDAIDTESRRLR